MAHVKDYIPTTIEGFRTWQINLVGRVVLNGASWNITPTQITDLQSEQTLYTNRFNTATTAATRTKSTIYDLKQQTKLYKKYIRGFVKTYLAFNPAVTGQQKIDLGINPGGNAPSTRPAILTAPHVSVMAKGNLMITIECRVESDSTRPSIHPDADGVELVGLFSNTPPASYAEALKLGISSKARFNHIHDEPADSGKNVYIFARWINISDPSKNGPWSDYGYTRFS